MAIVPVVQGLILCDFHVGYSDGKTDLYGIFNAVRPDSPYPYRLRQFCVFAQMRNGLGEVPFFVDIRDDADTLVRTTGTRTLVFPDRTITVQLALAIDACVFPRPGVYTIELFCDNTWVCDAQVRLL